MVDRKSSSIGLVCTNPKSGLLIFPHQSDDWSASEIQSNRKTLSPFGIEKPQDWAKIIVYEELSSGLSFRVTQNERLRFDHLWNIAFLGHA